LSSLETDQTDDQCAAELEGETIDVSDIDGQPSLRTG